MWIFDEVVELVVEQRRREEKPTLVARFGNDGMCCRMRKAWTSDALRCQYLPFWTVLPCDYIEFREWLRKQNISLVQISFYKPTKQSETKSKFGKANKFCPTEDRHKFDRSNLGL